MQTQALSLVLTWLHKWVSKFKNSWTKEPPWRDWDLFGCWSAQLLQEGGRETAHILRTRLCLAQVPAAREGTEQLYNLCVPSLLQGCHNPPTQTGSVPHGTTQQRVCQAAAVLWLSVISGRITLQICSVLLQAHLCFFSVTAEGLGDRSQVGSGLPAYHWNLFLQHTNLTAQHCLQSRKKKSAFDCFDIISNTGVT